VLVSVETVAQAQSRTLQVLLERTVVELLHPRRVLLLPLVLWLNGLAVFPVTTGWLVSWLAVERLVLRLLAYWVQVVVPVVVVVRQTWPGLMVDRLSSAQLIITLITSIPPVVMLVAQTVVAVVAVVRRHRLVMEPRLLLPILLVVTVVLRVLMVLRRRRRV
jgi:hypothetical protein